jgi:hypothetical protein
MENQDYLLHCQLDANGISLKIKIYNYARKPRAFKPGDEWHPFEALPGGPWQSGVFSGIVWHGRRSCQTMPAGLKPRALDRGVVH